MFKNATIYRLGTLAATLNQAEAALQRAQFAACGATQEKSAGFVPPRGEQNGALAKLISDLAEALGGDARVANPS